MIMTFLLWIAYFLSVVSGFLMVAGFLAVLNEKKIEIESGVKAGSSKTNLTATCFMVFIFSLAFIFATLMI